MSRPAKIPASARRQAGTPEAPPLVSTLDYPFLTDFSPSPSPALPESDPALSGLLLQASSLRHVPSLTMPRDNL